MDTPDEDRPPIVPPFIIAFVAMVAIASLGVILDRALVRIDDLRTVLLGMALFALGTRVNVGRLRQIGARPAVSGSPRGSLSLSWLMAGRAARLGLSPGNLSAAAAAHALADEPYAVAPRPPLRGP